MRVLMGVIKDRHGTYYARKAIPNKPEGLQAAVARVLENDERVQKHLKRSLATKDVREANIRAKPVLAEFDRIIIQAKAMLAAAAAPTIKLTSLSDTEINRIAEYIYADAMAWDELVRFGGRVELERMGTAKACRLTSGHSTASTLRFTNRTKSMFWIRCA